MTRTCPCLPQASAVGRFSIADYIFFLSVFIPLNRNVEILHPRCLHPCYPRAIKKMSGIYIHIPFCKKRCTYCDFYTEVAPEFVPALIDAIVKELHIRRDYLPQRSIQTIYFGGGTPSILNADDFQKIFDAVFAFYQVDDDAEITFEANPDDLTPDFFNSISSLPFNRISIGIQSFDDRDLKRINRRHTADEAVRAVKNAQQAGFTNVSIDLIYGLPFQTIALCEKQLDKALELGVQHISDYGLTYEEGTALLRQREKGELKTVDDETMNEMYKLLVRRMQQSGFEAYEISNFAQQGFRSRHNASYWKQQPYIGVGPSAHSYDLHSRQWNMASITEYISSIDNNKPFFEREELTLTERYNDYVMVSLRTAEGIDLRLLDEMFGAELKTYCLKNAETFLQNGTLTYTANTLKLTTEGVLVSNLILSALIKA
jgi:oxygen-independent coproporphyrinogen-3 oxidase